MKVKYWQVVASITSMDNHGNSMTTQVPTFFLNAEIQGILTEEHAKKVAGGVINPLRFPAVVIDMTIYPVTGQLRK